MVKTDGTKAIKPVVIDFIPESLALNKKSIAASVNGKAVQVNSVYRDGVLTVTLPDFLGEAMVSYETEVKIDEGTIENIALFTSDNNPDEPKEADARVIAEKLKEEPKAEGTPSGPINISSGNPKTGDNNQVLLYVCLGFASVIGFALLRKYRKAK